MERLHYPYLTLPSVFYAPLELEPLERSTLWIENHSLAEELNLSKEWLPQILETIQGNKRTRIKSVFAQAYAGHQFGHFTMLGDGRAAVIGELALKDRYLEIQLKGSGPTPYSRGGDGKATSKSMLREYLYSEAINGLGIPSSRSLGIIRTGEEIRRETNEPGAILIRLMQSHVRVGTFEYARYFQDHDALKALFTYCANRFYPTVMKEENPVLSFISKVAEKQFDLIAQWMRVGFIHGVMNTDNTSITGETFDYGPCAFMNPYEPSTVYSSIDRQGRYAFGNQPNIIAWNMVRLAEALLPLVDPVEKRAIAKATALIESFESQWKKTYYGMMLQKIGLPKDDEKGHELVDSLLSLMSAHGTDYTNTFASLCHDIDPTLTPWSIPAFNAWKKEWTKTIEGSRTQTAETLKRMQAMNPVIIPRNHWVEKTIDAAVHAEGMQAFLEAITPFASPYNTPKDSALLNPPPKAWEATFKTYCGT